MCIILVQLKHSQNDLLYWIGQICMCIWLVKPPQNRFFIAIRKKEFKKDKKKIIFNFEHWNYSTVVIMMELTSDNLLAKWLNYEAAVWKYDWFLLPNWMPYGCLFILLKINERSSPFRVYCIHWYTQSILWFSSVSIFNLNANFEKKTSIFCGFDENSVEFWWKQLKNDDCVSTMRYGTLFVFVQLVFSEAERHHSTNNIPM